MTMVSRPETVDNRKRAKLETLVARLIERRPMSVREVQMAIRGGLKAAEIRELMDFLVAEKTYDKQ